MEKILGELRSGIPFLRVWMPMKPTDDFKKFIDNYNVKRKESKRQTLDGDPVTPMRENTLPSKRRAPVSS
jgi:hypothetical protein